MLYIKSLQTCKQQFCKLGNKLKELNYIVLLVILDSIFILQVAWLRVDTQTILTISNHVITKNHRIAVTHIGHRTWSLHIKYTRQSDSGWYMCQVNTDPMSSIVGFLEVVGKDQIPLIFLEKIVFILYLYLKKS